MAGFALPLIMSGASLLSGLLGNRKQEQVQTQNSTSNYNNTSKPVYDGNMLELRNRLVAAYLSSMEDFDSNMDGEILGGLGNINQAGNQSSSLMERILASRGIRGPAAGYAMSMPRIQQQMNSANYLNTIPQMREQRKYTNLQNAGNFLQSLPVGQNQYGTQEQNSTTRGTIPSNMLGGGFNSLASSLAYQAGRGMWNGGQKQPTQGYVNPYYKLPGAR
jgi:hypothetical protein